MSAADHREGRGRVEQGRAGRQRDGLLARVDQLEVQLVGLGARANAEQPVLRVQKDLDGWVEKARDAIRNTDAKVDDFAGTEFLCRPCGDDVAGVGHVPAPGTSASRSVLGTMRLT